MFVFPGDFARGQMILGVLTRWCVDGVKQRVQGRFGGVFGHSIVGSALSTMLHTRWRLRLGTSAI